MQKRAEKRAFDQLMKDMERPKEGHIRLNGGGRFKKGEGEDGLFQKWEDTGKMSTDFMSIVLQIFLFKLNRVLNLDSRTIVSRAGDLLFVVVRADEQDLKTAAEDQEYTM